MTDNTAFVAAAIQAAFTVPDGAVCTCTTEACYGDDEGNDLCVVCHHLDPECPCPAEEDRENWGNE